MAFTSKTPAVGTNGNLLFGETGSGGSSAFQPLIGDPRIEPRYFSWLVNQKPAMKGFALNATLQRIRATRGAMLGRAPGLRNVVQLDRKDGTVYTSHSSTWTQFQADVHRRLTDEVPVSPVTRWGVTGGGICRPWDKLATSGALAMTPTLKPRLDKIGKAPAAIPADYLKLLRLVTEIYSAKWTPRAVPQNNTSYSGILADTHSKGEKIDYFINKIVKPYGPVFLEKLGEYDADWFVQKFGTAPVVYTTARWQLDAIGKVRAGHNYLGEEVTADKNVPKEYSVGFEQMVAARERTAYAVEGMCNLATAAYFTGIRYNAMNDHAATWHTATGKDLTDAIEKFGNFEQYDAVAFDQSFDRIEIDTITNSLVGLSEKGKAAVTRLSHLPMVVKSDIRGEAGAYLFNNAEYNAGHQSGVQWVSDYNKIRGTSHWLYGLVKIGYLRLNLPEDVIKSKIVSILVHDDPYYAIINQGDDTTALSSSSSDLEKWCVAVENLDFAIWERDATRKMIGYVFYQKTPTSPLTTIVDAVTLVEKLIINERSVHSNHRKMSSTGNLDRLHQLVTQVEAGPQIKRILDECALKWFGKDMEELYKETLYKDVDGLDETIDVRDLSGFNSATIQFIQDPDAIHKNKIKIEDIDPRVYNSYFATLSAADAAWCGERLGLFDFEVNDKSITRKDPNDAEVVLDYQTNFNLHIN